MEFYPLQFQPIYKERLWGGNKLHTLLGKDSSGDTVGESWEISAVPGDVSVVANGKLKGRSLQDLVETYTDKFLGKHIFERFGTAFPILIKFIDAKHDLSIQLHPDDELAKRRHNSFGKTEMWYIMQADTDAQLIIGFNEDVSKKTYQQHLKNNTLTDILHYEPVKEGDAFFISPGKVHAIGGGIVLAEIQQTSDITYRIFDFNRRDKNGKLRELHTKQALDAIDYKKKADFKLKYKKTQNKPATIASCPYFTTNYLHLKNTLKHVFTGRDAFTVYMCVEGDLKVTGAGETVRLKKGETLLIPATIEEITFHTENATLLEVYI